VAGFRRPFRQEEPSVTRTSRKILVAVLLALFFQLPAVAAREAEDPEKPESPAERVSGRWRIALSGLAEDHDPILASFAVEGDLLIGTLTVGRETVSIHSGRIIGSQFKFSFRHVSGEPFQMRGAPGPQGLEGTWRSDRSDGRWTARPLDH
jgi:hypothetical protein